MKRKTAGSVLTAFLLLAGLVLFAGCPESDTEPVRTEFDIIVTQPEKGGSFTVRVGGGSPIAESTTAKAGEVITLTRIPPDAGYRFNGFNLTGGDIDAGGISQRTFTMPANDVRVTAVFEAIVYTVTVIQPPEGGSFTAAVDGGPAGKGSASALMGQTITLTATADTAAGYRFVVFSLSGTSMESGSGPVRTFVMPAGNATVGAVFEHGTPVMAQKDVLYSKGYKRIARMWETAIILEAEKYYEVTVQYKTPVNNAMNILICRGDWDSDVLEEERMITTGVYAGTNALLQTHPNALKTMLRFPGTDNEWVTMRFAFQYTHRLASDINNGSPRTQLGVQFFFGTIASDRTSEVWVNYLGIRELDDGLEPIGPNLVSNSDFSGGVARVAAFRNNAEAAAAGWVFPTTPAWDWNPDPVTDFDTVNVSAPETPGWVNN